ncbi:hypothetical protein [Sinorhizobium meliloti]|jgi:hypothetical protein|uniref:hypothetical protein n=1 Tax=Rhizobium meliloti TaxID=382 RepID=UPI001298103C|nr:hypothetical protein [Sinorhizobium meliloti]MQU72373.1 hypothetical protein [Sinorhizobium meliloti]
MAWRRQSTSVSVDVDLDDFDEMQLLQGLIDAKWISQAEAEAIAARASISERSINISTGADFDLLDRARQYLRMGNRQEAIIHLERFLGRDWMGALQ